MVLNSTKNFGVERKLRSLPSRAISTIVSPTNIPYTIKIAASNASTISKKVATYICNGTADNVEIQTAINSLHASNGGIIQLSEGTFNIAAKITISNANVTIEGSGGGISTTYTNSVLRQINGANLDFIIYSTGYNPKFSNFLINGNRDNNTTTVGFYHSGLTTNPVFQNVSVRFMPSHGFTIRCNGYAIGCYSELNTGMGWNISSAAHFQMWRCNGQNNGNTGVYISNSKYIGVHASMIDTNGATTTRDGVYIDIGAYHCVIEGNMIQSSSRHGIFIETNGGNGYHIITGNQVSDSGIETDNTYGAITLTNTKHNIIIGNICALDAQAINPKYNLEETGTSDYNNFSHNDLSGAQTANTSIIGVNSVAQHNIAV